MALWGINPTSIGLSGASVLSAWTALPLGFFPYSGLQDGRSSAELFKESSQAVALVCLVTQLELRVM
jgi:hypothetical protein